MPKLVLGAVSRWNSETLGFLANIWLTERFGISVADTAAFIMSGNVYSNLLPIAPLSTQHRVTAFI
jgi:hypothetical protein